MLCTLVFQAISEYEWDIKTIDILMNVVASSNQWVNYRIARAATRYGHNNIADMVFSNMPLQVSYLNIFLFKIKLSIIYFSNQINLSKKIITWELL